MTIALLLSFLVSILPSSVVGNIGNEHLDILDYAYTRAVDAGINPIKFIKLINCESEIDKTAKGDFQTETGKYISQGILQFQKSTYNTYSKRYGLVGTWLSPYSQINLAARMISREKDGWRHWYHCARAVHLDDKS